MSSSDRQHIGEAQGASQRAASTVTFCINELDPGGAERALVRIATGLFDRGWQVNVVSLRDAGDLVERLEAAGISVTALECGGFVDIRAVFRLRRVLQQQRPDVLVCFLHQANIVGRISGSLAGVRTVVSGIRVADRRKWVVWTDRLTRGLTQKYVAVSRHVADVHARLCGVRDDRMMVIRNGVDIPDPRPVRIGREDSGRRILFVGRLTDQKRPQNLVSAVAAMAVESGRRVVVDFLGDGELRSELQQQISAAGLNDRIRLHGYQPNVAEWMALADVLALPSDWEGLPNVVLEAMAQGLPVIATDVDGVPEIIEHGVTGWIVPPGDVTALADTLTNVLADVEGRRLVANRAFDAVQQRFRWDTTVEAFDDLLSGLCAPKADV
jgi:glycosyltransferase involved in cell wall biosynthesis